MAKKDIHKEIQEKIGTYEDKEKMCIFCKIIRGEIPSSKVYEDDEILAFLDIMPVHKGHTLVIPKQHYETILDTPDELLQKIITVVKKVGGAVIKAAQTDGFNVLQSNNETAGQVVPHLHFHIIPRHVDDNLKFWPQGKYNEGEMQEYLEDIKKHL